MNQPGPRSYLKQPVSGGNGFSFLYTVYERRMAAEHVNANSLLRQLRGLGASHAPADDDALHEMPSRVVKIFAQVGLRQNRRGHGLLGSRRVHCGRDIGLPVSPLSTESLGKFDKQHVNRGAKPVQHVHLALCLLRTDVAGSKTLNRNPGRVKNPYTVMTPCPALG